MNIDDVAEVPSPYNGNYMGTIFAKQQELMDRYDKIERSSGTIVPYPPYYLDDFAVQQRIKDMFWRTTEEVAEAFEELTNVLPYIQVWRAKWHDHSSIRHFYEELADAMHFLVEASIYARFSFHDGSWLTWDETPHHDPQVNAWQFTYRMGLAANCLKNKPWKQSQMPTDHLAFVRNMAAVWDAFVTLLASVNVELEDIYVLYMKKHTVNKFRQDTNY